MFDRQQFIDEIRETGSSLVEDALPPRIVEDAKGALVEAMRKENEYHQSNNHKDHGMVLLCPLYHEVFVNLFDLPLISEPFNAILGEGCITYAYTSSSMPPSGKNFSSRVHVDSPRMIPGYITNMGATILLDEFTEENGATWYLPGSQDRLEPPSDEEFYTHGKRVIAPAGSIWFFNARLWHAGGVNGTDRWRHATTLNMCRSYMKQRIDIPRALEAAGVDLRSASETARQKLGFLAQVPASYEEFYAPPERRKYQQKVE